MSTGLLKHYLNYGDDADKPATMVGTALESVLCLYWAEDTEKMYWWNWTVPGWVQVLGVGEVPTDGVKYVRLDGAWEAAPIQDDAPEDGTNYGRKDGAWVGIAEFPEAPEDGNNYARKDGGWVSFTTLSTEQVQDLVAAMATEGTGINLTYDDGAGTLTIECTITQYTNAMADARIAAAHLGDLADVDVASPTDGQVLTFDDSDNQWKPATPAAGTGDVEEAPEDGQLYARKDGAWESFEPGEGGGGGGGGTPIVLEYRYWRIQCLSSFSNAFCAVALEFRGTPGGANLATGGTPIAGSAIFGAEANAFDGDSGTFWGTGNESGQWIGYDFGTPVEIQEIAWTARSGSESSQTPRYFEVMYSDDNESWHTAWAGDFTAFSGSETKTNSGRSLVLGSAGSARTMASALINFTGVDPHVAAGFNIASVAKTGTGQYRITFDENIDTTKAGVSLSASWANGFSNRAIVEVGVERDSGAGIFPGYVDITTMYADAPTNCDGWISLDIFDVTVQAGGGLGYSAPTIVQFKGGRAQRSAGATITLDTAPTPDNMLVLLISVAAGEGMKIPNDFIPLMAARPGLNNPSSGGSDYDAGWWGTQYQGIYAAYMTVITGDGTSYSIAAGSGSEYFNYILYEIQDADTIEAHWSGQVAQTGLQYRFRTPRFMHGQDNGLYLLHSEQDDTPALAFASGQGITQDYVHTSSGNHVGVSGHTDSLPSLILVDTATDPGFERSVLGIVALHKRA